MTGLLDLSGRELERELQKIIEENPPKRKRWTEKEREVAFRLYRAGVPRKVIAQRLGRTISMINNQLDRLSPSNS